jgi:hypothetical protein
MQKKSKISRTRIDPARLLFTHFFGFVLPPPQALLPQPPFLGAAMYSSPLLRDGDIIMP